MNDGGAEPAILSTRIRLYVAGDLGAGNLVTLASGQIHYLRTVMRVNVGTGIRLFNGRDGEWLARVGRLDRSGGEAACVRRLRRQCREPGPRLLFAPLKKDAMDFVTMKATELGVAALWPVITRRTETLRVNAARLEAQTIEAAEQCGRLTVPELVPAAPLDRVLAAWDGGRALFVTHPAAPSGPDAAFRGAAGAGPPGFLIGPEGGFESDELDRLLALPFVEAVRLGPRILRAETAAVAVLACWQAIRGDWNAAGDATETDLDASED